MCFAAPKPPATPPPPPTIDKMQTDETILTRGNTRKRLLGAMNTRATMLSDENRSGKTLLGQ